MTRNVYGLMLDRFCIEMHLSDTQLMLTAEDVNYIWGRHYTDSRRNSHDKLKLDILTITLLMYGCMLND